MAADLKSTTGVMLNIHLCIVSAVWFVQDWKLPNNSQYGDAYHMCHGLIDHDASEYCSRIITANG